MSLSVGFKSYINFLVVFLPLCISLSVAQTPIDLDFSRADSLRGSLNTFRTCYDVKYYDLNLRIDPSNKHIEGNNLILLESRKDFEQIQLDLYANMVIDSIIFYGESLRFEREGHAFFVTFPETIEAGRVASIVIYYHGNPLIAKYPPWDGGFSWARDSLGRDWIGVSCEGIGASIWWPNKDHLSDRPDSMHITLEVPEKLTAVSNGKLLNTLPGREGYRKWHWAVSYPINNYNVTLNIAHYTAFQDRFVGSEGSLDLNYYVLDYNLSLAREQFQQVQPMLMCYEHFLGPYPFKRDGYKLVETPYYGMEHQSCIAYGNDFQNNAYGFDYIIIHESGHEYWGNSVCVQDLGELWVHEGFTTYMESLFIEYSQGRDAALEYLDIQREHISNKHPMIGPLGVNYDNWMDTDMYFKGSWMLHSVRNTINNDSLWFQLLKDTYQRFKYSTIVSNDIVDYMNEHVDFDLAPVFRNFLFNAQTPVLKTKERKKKNTIELSYMWKNTFEDFNMPVDILYGSEHYRLFPSKKKQKVVLYQLDGGTIQFSTDKFYFDLRKKFDRSTGSSSL